MMEIPMGDIILLERRIQMHGDCMICMEMFLNGAEILICFLITKKILNFCTTSN